MVTPYPIRRTLTADAICLLLPAAHAQDEPAKDLTLRGIPFDTGKAEIKAQPGPLLDETAPMLRKGAAPLLRIQGHTGNVGAKAMMAALVTRGIEVGRLAATGFGDTKPVGDNGTGEERQQNRRVEFVKR